MIPTPTLDSAKSILKAGTYPMVSGRPQATYDQIAEILTKAGYPISYIKVRRECLKVNLPTTRFGRIAIVDAEMALDAVALKPYMDGHLKRISESLLRSREENISPENPPIPHQQEDSFTLHNPLHLQLIEL